jgi:hypothetical protein
LEVIGNRQLATRRDVLMLGGSFAALAISATALGPAAQAAAPMLGISRPNIYRFKLGAFEVTNILDGYVQLRAHPTYGADQPQEAV